MPLIHSELKLITIYMVALLEQFNFLYQPHDEKMSRLNNSDVLPMFLSALTSVFTWCIVYW